MVNGQYQQADLGQSSPVTSRMKSWHIFRVHFQSNSG